MPPENFAPGTVWLVGAGPGDPELLTLKAVRLLQSADIVYFDALVGAGVLALIPPGTPTVSVGKRSGRHSKAQGEISALLVDAALSGLKVVRLKGGDPAIFGRATEELEALADAGIPTFICPGITAATAAAAAAGLSLTLRGSARSLTFATAHAREGAPLDLDWGALAATRGTLAFYMGRAAAGSISSRLIAHGLPPETPVLVAANVGSAAQKLVHGRLEALPFLVRAVCGDDPAVLLIGEAMARAEHAKPAPQATQVTAAAADFIN
jgi:uroporphyrin-III C-methyltransferase